MHVVKNVLFSDFAVLKPNRWTYRVVLVMDMVFLPLLVQLSHVHQTILHLLQTPDLLPSTPTPNLNCWFTEYCIPL